MKTKMELQSQVFVTLFFTLFVWNAGIFLTLVSGEDPLRDTPLSSYQVMHGWTQLDFKFESDNQRMKYLNTSLYIPSSNVITRIRVSKHDTRIFLTVPRWGKGVPATLVYIMYNPTESVSKNPTMDQKGNDTGPLLIPYPNWNMQTVGDCSNGIQSAQAIEIDIYNRLWVLDTGLSNGINSTQNEKCPPKLWIFNLNTNVLISSYEFPNMVVSHENNFFNDLVVGCVNTTMVESRDECWGYISEAVGGKIIVYHLRNNQSWAVKHQSMEANETATNVTILGHSYNIKTNLDGIGLSPLDQNFDKVYYSPLSSFNIYSVSTKILQKAGSNGYVYKLKDDEIETVGIKPSQSDGIMMDSKGLLFYGVLSSNAISFWNTTTTSQPINHDTATNGPLDRGSLLVQNDIELQWPSSFAFDNHGYIYAITNRLHRYFSNSYDPNDINFRIVRTFIGSKSYQYLGNEVIQILELNDTYHSSYDEKSKYQHDNSGSNAANIKTLSFPIECALFLLIGTLAY